MEGMMLTEDYSGLLFVLNNYRIENLLFAQANHNYCLLPASSRNRHRQVLAAQFTSGNRWVILIRHFKSISEKAYLWKMIGRAYPTYSPS